MDRISILQETKDPHKFSGLRKVFVEHTKCAFSNNIDGTSFYDKLYRIIVDEIKKCEQQQNRQAVLSWLTTNQDKQEAIAASRKIPPISDIRNPFAPDQPKRDQVKFGFFAEFYHDKLNAKRATKNPKSEKTSSKKVFKLCQNAIHNIQWS